MQFPSKSPTPSEYAVIAVVIAGLLIVFGTVGLVVGFMVPPEKHAVAVDLMRVGGSMLGLGLFVAAAYWGVRRLSE